MEYSTIAGELSVESGKPIYLFDFLSSMTSSKKVEYSRLFLFQKDGTRTFCGDYVRDAGRTTMQAITALCLADTDCYMYYAITDPILLPEMKKSLDIKLSKHFGPLKESPLTPCLPPPVPIPNISEPVIWVKNYGPSSHALFNVSIPLAKELAYYSATRAKELFSYNENLTFSGKKSPGWIIREKRASQEVKNLFLSLGVHFLEQ